MQPINWYMPQYGVRTKALIPNPDEVQEGRIYRIPYNFLGIVANATGQNYITPSVPFLIWGLTASITGGTGAGFQFAAYHRYGSYERRLEPTMDLSSNALGTAQRPMLLKSPYLIDTGEALGFQLRSLESANTVDIQIVVWGSNLVHVPAGVMPQ